MSKFKPGDRVRSLLTRRLGTVKSVNHHTSGDSVVVQFDDNSESIVSVCNEKYLELVAASTTTYADPQVVTLESGETPEQIELPVGTSEEQKKKWGKYSAVLGANELVETPEEQKKKWKEEGRCEICGELRPMSAWGLLDCPKHPSKPEGPI